MNTKELINHWKTEEKAAHIHGWDFGHISGRYTEEDDLPWDYRSIIQHYLKPKIMLLDIDTGGGEFLLSLNHPHNMTAATEAYPPNVQLCKETLLPLGVDFREASGDGILPFDDNSFEIVINRHGDCNPNELFRILKPGGLFITQQVGAYNDRELVELVCGDLPLSFPEQRLDLFTYKFLNAGFKIIDSAEHYGKISFFDIGALVWFSKIIEWEFIDFSVEKCLDNLKTAHRICETEGSVSAKTHRFYLVAKK